MFGHKNKSKNFGFTIIELLVVISIMALLSSITMVGLNSARIRARDARRVSDLRQMQVSLELFYGEYGEYPPKFFCTDTSIGGRFVCGNLPVGASWYAGGFGVLAYPAAINPDPWPIKYMSELPVDPINNSSYFYLYSPISNESKYGITCISTTCGYVLSAYLEAPGNSEIMTGCDHIWGRNYCLTGGGAQPYSP